METADIAKEKNAKMQEQFEEAVLDEKKEDDHVSEEGFEN